MPINRFLLLLVFLSTNVCKKPEWGKYGSQRGIVQTGEYRKRQEAAGGIHETEYTKKQPV